MRIDLPCCGFKNCRYQFDGNCTNKKEYERCEYMELITDLESRQVMPNWDDDLEPLVRIFRD